MRALYFISISFLSLLLQSCGGTDSGFPSGGCGGQNSDPCDPYVIEVIVTPDAQTLDIGVTSQYQAIAVYDNGNQVDVSELAAWQSGDTSVVSISDLGVATTLASGTSEISATFDGVEGAANLIVVDKTPLSLAVSPIQTLLLPALSQQYRAVVHYTDGSTWDVTEQSIWSTIDTAIASIDDNGVATANAAGDTFVSANYDGLSSQANLLVSNGVPLNMAVTPTSITIPTGTTTQFHAAIVLDNGDRVDVTDLADWLSSSAIAEVNDHGLVAGIEEGSSRISASIAFAEYSFTDAGEVIDSSPSLTALQVSPANGTYPRGTKGTYTATAFYSDGSSVDVSHLSEWRSSNNDTATIINNGEHAGEAIAMEVGDTEISATFSDITSSAQAIVISPTLDYIQLSPLNKSTPLGTNVAYHANAVFSDGLIKDITREASWQSSTPSVAVIDGIGAASGLAHSIQIGTTTIQASYLGESASTSLTVTDATLVSVTVTPTRTTLAVGVHNFYHATALYNNGETIDVTHLSNWTSDHADIAQVSNAEGNKGEAIAITTGDTTITATFSGMTGSAELIVSAAELVEIQVLPSNAQVSKGFDIQFTAYALLTDATKHDITRQAMWQSADASIATIDSTMHKGLATGANTGDVEILASYMGLQGNAKLTVTEAVPISLALTPYRSSVLVSHNITYTATAQLSDGSRSDVSHRVSWQLSDNSIASISSTGIATGLSGGETDVIVSLKLSDSDTPLMANAELFVKAETVSIESLNISPYRARIFEGGDTAYHATAHLNDGSQLDVTENVQWTTADTNIASINFDGIAHGSNQGMTAVTATIGYNGLLFQSDAELYVTAPTVTISEIQVTPYRDAILIGHRQSYTATALLSDGSNVDITDSAVWSTSENNIATIQADGQAMGISEGVTIIQATIGYQGEVHQGSATLFVKPATITIDNLQLIPYRANIFIGGQQQYQAIANMSDGSKVDVTDLSGWTSADESIATVSFSGTAIGIAAGEADITASYNHFGDIAVASAQLYVSGITATVEKVQVSPFRSRILVDHTQAYSAVAILSDGQEIDITHYAAWSSDDTNIATMQSGPVAIGLAEGAANITASIGFGGAIYQGQAKLFVKEESVTIETIKVLPPYSTTLVDGSELYVAFAILSDGTSVDVTERTQWSVADNNIARIDQQGILTGRSEGITDVLASVNDNGTLHQGRATIEVKAPEVLVTQLRITPVSHAMLVEDEFTYVATATMDDGTQHDVSHSVQWSVGDPLIAEMQDASGTVFALSGGETLVIAKLSYGGSDFIAVSQLSVVGKDETVVHIEVLPTFVKLPVDGDRQMQAFATFESGAVVDVTESGKWTPGQPDIISVSSTGLVHGIAIGHTPLNCNVLNFTKSINVEVTEPNSSVASVSFSPNDATLLIGSTQLFNATAIWIDGTEVDVTADAVWTTDNGDVAAPAAPNGTVLGVGEGVATIKGSYKVGNTNYINNATVTVKEADIIIADIIVSPASSTIHTQTVLQYTAQAELSDGSLINITQEAFWNSSDANIAGFNDNNGLIYGLKQGAVTVTASFRLQGIDYVGTASLLVTNKTPSRLEISPQTIALNVDDKQQYTATLYYDDNSAQDVTDNVIWSSSNEAVLAVTNAVSGGFVTAVSDGSADLTANFQGQFADILSITVSP